MKMYRFKKNCTSSKKSVSTSSQKSVLVKKKLVQIQIVPKDKLNYNIYICHQVLVVPSVGVFVCVAILHIRRQSSYCDHMLYDDCVAQSWVGSQQILANQTFDDKYDFFFFLGQPNSWQEFVSLWVKHHGGLSVYYTVK